MVRSSTQYEAIHSTKQYTVRSNTSYEAVHSTVRSSTQYEAVHRTVHRTQYTVHRAPYRTPYTALSTSRSRPYGALGTRLARVSSSAPPRRGPSCAADTSCTHGAIFAAPGRGSCRCHPCRLKRPRLSRTRCRLPRRRATAAAPAPLPSGAGCVRAVRACGAFYGTPGPWYSGVPVGACARCVRGALSTVLLARGT